MGEGITVTTFDGHNINDGATYESKFLREVEPNATFEAAMVAPEIAGDFPSYVRGQPGGKVMPLYIRVKTPTLANIRTLKAWMTPYDDEVYLKGADTDAVVWRLRVKCLQLVPFHQLDGVFVARLYATEPVWEQDSEQSDSQANKSASPIDWTLTPTGSTRCYPTFEITPTASKDHANGWKRRWQVIMANKVPRPLMDTLGLGYSLDIANDSLDTATEIAAGRLQADGDDLRVFIDGKKISGHIGSDRWLDGLATATCKVWGLIYLSPCKTATLRDAMTVASPADGESIYVNNPGGLADWPESGFFVVDDECYYYASRTVDSFDNINRAVRNTTAATHSAAITAYWVEHEIVIEYDYTAATNPPASDDLKPIIDLASSTNGKHVYPAPFTLPSTKRSGQFSAVYDDINSLSPYISLNDTGSVVKFVDTPASEGKPKRNCLDLYVPCGVDAAAAALEHDVTVPANMLLRVLGKDMDGNDWTTLAEYNPDTDGVNKQISPTSPLAWLRYAAMVRTVTAAEPTIPLDIAAGQGVIGTVSEQVAEQFTLDQACTLCGVSVRLKKTTGADGNVVVHIMKGGTAGDPDSGGYVVWNELLVAAADISNAAFELYTMFFYGSRTVPAGSDYYLILERTASAYAIYWGSQETTNAKASMWFEDADVWTENPGRDFWFRILGDGSVCQDEVPFSTAEEIQVDNVEVTLDTPPYVKVCASEEIYSYSARLDNLTTGQSIDINCVSALNQKLTINCATKQVTGGQLGLPVAYAIECSDEAEMMYLVPGTNSMRYTETGIGTIGIVSKWRGRWS